MQKPVKILQASAGSGKTFSLAVHYLTLLFSSDSKYREILAVTFTNKATEEMKSRILEVLKGLALDSESSSIESYRNLILKAYPHFTRESLADKADKIYRKILHDYSRFSVSTIDGFVQRVVRSLAFELDLDASYTLEMNIDKVKDNLVERLDKELDKKPALVRWIIELAKERIEQNKSWNYKAELLTLTSEIFKERFAAFEEALNSIGLDRADAVFSAYAKASRESVKKFENAIVDFAQKGLEIKQRYGVETEQLKGKSRNPLLRLNKFAAGDFKDIEKIFVLIDTSPDEWFQKGQSQDLYYELNPLLNQLQNFYNQNYPDYVLNQQFNKNVYFLRLMVELAGLLHQYRKESGSLLISDAQNLLTTLTGEKDANPSFIWEKIGSRYRNFLFDEFQDTSVKQWKSFLSLVSNAVAEPSGNLVDNLIVGDTKQAIYRWRNGDWNILHNGARNDIGTHHVIDESLEENYRSSSVIIEFNNQLYHKLAGLIQQKINGEVEGAANESILKWWQSKAYDQIITSVYSQSAQKKTPRTPEGGIVKIRKVKKSDDDERTFSDTVFREYSLNYLVEEIKGLKEDRGYQYKDISVLVRSNREAVETVETLMAANIPVVSGEALLIAGNTSIKLIINTLYALAGYEENTSLYKANCIALYHKISGRPVHPHSYLNLRYRRLSDLGALLPPDLCANANSWLQLPLPELVEKIIKAYGIAQQEVYLPYLLAFRDVVANATRQGEKGIHSFLNWWEEDGIRKALPTPEEADAVQIITIHKSKGLAFRAVFIPFCDLELSGKSNSIFWVPADGTPYKDLGSIPLKYSKELAKSTIAPYYFEEELYGHMDTLNMIYVATTRAKDFLYLGTKAKEKEDAKSLGDLLNLIYKDQFDEQESLYLEGRFLIQEEDIVLKDTIELKGYPTSDRISEIYKTEEERHANHLLNLEESGRRGSILHDILANATSEQEVESYVEDLNMEGVITVDEKDDFIQEARGVLNHPDLKQLLDKADRTIVEKGIIDITGKQHRPDKVLVSNDEIIVIDYKFTVKEQESHISQLSSYKTILAEMGYSKVSAYLFYALSKTLKAV